MLHHFIHHLFILILCILHTDSLASHSQLSAQPDSESDRMLVTVRGTPLDICEDEAALGYIKNGTLPSDPAEKDRVVKRGKHFHWHNGKLYKSADTPTGTAYKLVPVVSERENIISQMHVELGHMGEKRTTSAVSQVFWWSGLTLDVKRVLSACKVCRRVHTSEAYQPREMLTLPPTQGMF